MNPAPEHIPDDHVDRSRQLILTQVQLMELEDARDDLTTRLQQAESLLDQTRRLGDHVLGEHERLAETHRALQREVEAFRTQEKELRSLLAAANERIGAITRELEQEQVRAAMIEGERNDALALAAERLEQTERLKAMIADLLATRSWRYTKPLRRLENMLARGGR